MKCIRKFSKLKIQRSLKILFLTTHNLATNPRLLKEMDLALTNGHQVELVCFEFDNWSYPLNERLKERFSKVKMHIIPAGRKKLVPWAVNVITEKSFRYLGRLFTLSLRALSSAVSRRSNMIVRALKNIENADWVIGHNPGALYATSVAKKKFKCKAGFDVEDYHPGEGNDVYMQGLTKKLMVALLPCMNYVSFASSLIKQQTEEDNKGPLNNWFTVLNYFPSNEFTTPFNAITGPVKMVWFSQNINAGRGLELVSPFVKAANSALELHLIGHTNTDFYSKYLKDNANIIIHAPMTQLDLHRSLAKFDIGLALEPAKDKNNKLAVSNKILAYLQAGLFVLATNTPAQEKLLEEFPNHGVCFGTDASQVQAVIKRVVEQVGVIRSNRLARYEALAGKNWEAASLELLKRWGGDN